jgi:hypothetical protein
MDAVNQWLGDTMILQSLCDSDNVNEQEREVLQRWILAAKKPEDEPTPLTPEQEAVAKRAWAMAHEIMWEGTNLRIEDVVRATLREKPDLSTDVLRENGDLSTGTPATPETVDLSEWLAQTEGLVAELVAEMRDMRAKYGLPQSKDGHIDCIRGRPEAFINAPIRFCAEANVLCGLGCGAGPCKAKE